MPNKQIEIGDKAYEVIDAKENMTVPDCWVLKNKIGKGHGEAKFYVGQHSQALWKFFDNLSRQCFFLKSDLIKYLEEVKQEYETPEQPYKNKSTMPNEWKKYIQDINAINGEIIPFTFQHQRQIEPPRIYFNSDDDIYKIIRKISLPNITYISALKVKSSTGEISYYFRLFVDYLGKEKEEKEVVEEIKESKLSDPIKEILVRARRGQGKYREGVLAECPYCPITMVSDDRLLIASHIKPWVKSELNEKIDPKNGFMLTPTYDFLFDRGFITFTDDQKMLVSPWLSKMTCSKLSLADGKKYTLLPIEGREKYLEYHRKNIFKS
jgi:hypothetical protein